MGKYRKDFNTDADDESASHFKAPKFRDSEAGGYERGWKNNKKKSKQFRQARKKRSLTGAY